MPALRFKTCRLLSGNVWNRELTIIQRRILRRLRNKKRSIKRKIYPRENLNSYIQSQTTRKLPLFHGDLPITEMHRRRERTSYIPFLNTLIPLSSGAAVGMGNVFSSQIPLFLKRVFVGLVKRLVRAFVLLLFFHIISFFGIPFSFFWSEPVSAIISCMEFFPDGINLPSEVGSRSVLPDNIDLNREPLSDTAESGRGQLDLNNPPVQDSAAPAGSRSESSQSYREFTDDELRELMESEEYKETETEILECEKVRTEICQRAVEIAKSLEVKEYTRLKIELAVKEMTDVDDMEEEQRLPFLHEFQKSLETSRKWQEIHREIKKWDGEGIC